MERLTNKAWRNFDPWECCGQDKYCQRGCHDPGGCTKGCIVPQLYARSGAYEDTDLTPEEVSSLVKDWSDLCTIIGECGGLDRVRALDEADKDGRLVVLPCKVGDTVWAILGDKKYACKCIVEYVNIGGRGLGTTIVLCEAEGLREQYGVTVAAFGKTVFLTREEAEKALEAKKGE